MSSATYSLLVLVIDLATKTFLIVDLVLQAEGVVLEAVSGLNALAGSLVLLGILLSLFNHAVNLLLSETALIVGDSDGLGLASALVVGRHLEDTVGVKLKGNLNLGHATGRGGKTWIKTTGWLSAAVEKIWLLRVGMGVLRGISFVMTPPVVSIPRVSGLTSMRTMSPVPSSPESTPA